MFILVIANIDTAYATNFVAQPIYENEISPGDTYDKGDGDLKVFNRKGEMIYSGSMRDYQNLVTIKTDTGGSFGNYEGYTDIYWDYGDLLGLNSGPVVECSTASYDADGSDYLYVKNELFIDDDGVWDRLKYSSDTVFDGYVAEAYANQLSYGFFGYVGGEWKGSGRHSIEDSDEGWDDTFFTNETI